MEDSFFLVGEEKADPFLYEGCGLEGIYLLNGVTIEEYDGEEYVSIRDLEGLHKAIGRHLVTHRKALSPKEIRFLRNTMGYTQAELAMKLGNNSQSVARWEKGECEMPGAAEKLLRAIFLVWVMSTEELFALRDFLLSKLSEMDELDELKALPAQFSFLDRWTQKATKAA